MVIIWSSPESPRRYVLRDAHGSQMGQSLKVPVVHQLLNVITRAAAGEEGDACFFLIKSRKRGGGDGAVIEREHH